MSLIRRLLSPLVALLAVALPASAQARAPAEARPALWAVSDPDTTIYLFGTIHLLPENFRWRTPALEQAVAGSDELVVETVVDTKDPTKLMSALAGMAFSKGLPPVVERVPAAKRAQVEAAMAKSGIPKAALDQMETWAVAFMLLGDQFRSLGLKNAQGVEAVLRDNFLNRGKKIGELETNVEQLGYFDTLSEKAQRALLEGAIEKPADMRKEFAQMLDAWASGDVGRIGRTFDEQLSASPELRDALIRRRNSNWSQWIARRMQQPGRVLLAVGAGHLAGSDSVISMLKKAGYRVRRIQ